MTDPDKTDTSWRTRAVRIQAALLRALLWGVSNPKTGMALTFAAGMAIGWVTG